MILAVIGEIGVGGRQRTPCSSSSARAPRRCRSTSGWPSRTWRSRRARRTACSPPTHEDAAYLEGRARSELDAGRLRSDATFRRGSTIDLTGSSPLVAKPWSPATSAGVGGRPVPVDQVYIGNCANGTMTDLRQAAACSGPAASIRGRARSSSRRRSGSGARRGRGTARRVRRGRSDGLDPDVRRVLRRLERDPRRRGGRRRDDEPQLPRPDGRDRRRRLPRQRLGRRRRCRGRRDRRPGGDRCEIEGAALVASHGDNIDTDVMYPGRSSTSRTRADGAVPLRGLRPGAARAARRRHRSSSSTRTSASALRASTFRSR